MRNTLEDIWALLTSLVVAMGTRLPAKSRKGIAIGSWWIIGIVIALVIVGGIVIAVIVLTPSGTTTTVPYP